MKEQKSFSQKYAVCRFQRSPLLLIVSVFLLAQRVDGTSTIMTNPSPGGTAGPAPSAVLEGISLPSARVVDDRTLALNGAGMCYARKSPLCIYTHTHS